MYSYSRWTEPIGYTSSSRAVRPPPRLTYDRDDQKKWQQSEEENNYGEYQRNYSPNWRDKNQRNSNYRRSQSTPREIQNDSKYGTRSMTQNNGEEDSNQNQKGKGSNNRSNTPSRSTVSRSRSVLPSMLKNEKRQTSIQKSPPRTQCKSDGSSKNRSQTPSRSTKNSSSQKAKAESFKKNVSKRAVSIMPPPRKKHAVKKAENSKKNNSKRTESISPSSRNNREQKKVENSKKNVSKRVVSTSPPRNKREEKKVPNSQKHDSKRGVLSPSPRNNRGEMKEENSQKRVARGRAVFRHPQRKSNEDRTFLRSMSESPRRSIRIANLVKYKTENGHKLPDYKYSIGRNRRGPSSSNSQLKQKGRNNQQRKITNRSVSSRFNEKSNEISINNGQPQPKRKCSRKNRNSPERFDRNFSPSRVERHSLNNADYYSDNDDLKFNARASPGDGFTGQGYSNSLYSRRDPSRSNNFSFSSEYRDHFHLPPPANVWNDYSNVRMGSYHRFHSPPANTRMILPAGGIEDPSTLYSRRERKPSIFSFKNENYTRSVVSPYNRSYNDEDYSVNYPTGTSNEARFKNQNFFRNPDNPGTSFESRYNNQNSLRNYDTPGPSFSGRMNPRNTYDWDPYSNRNLSGPSYFGWMDQRDNWGASEWDPYRSRHLPGSSYFSRRNERDNDDWNNSMNRNFSRPSFSGAANDRSYSPDRDERPFLTWEPFNIQNRTNQESVVPFRFRSGGNSWNQPYHRVDNFNSYSKVDHPHRYHYSRSDSPFEEDIDETEGNNGYGVANGSNIMELMEKKSEDMNYRMINEGGEEEGPFSPVSDQTNDGYQDENGEAAEIAGPIAALSLANDGEEDVNEERTEVVGSVEVYSDGEQSENEERTEVIGPIAIYSGINDPDLNGNEDTTDNEDGPIIDLTGADDMMGAEASQAIALAISGANEAMQEIRSNMITSSMITVNEDGDEVHQNNSEFNSSQTFVRNGHLVTVKNAYQVLNQKILYTHDEDSQ